MSKIRVSTTRASSRVTANTIVLALWTMGPRYGREVAQILARRVIHLQRITTRNVLTSDIFIMTLEKSVIK
jgi:hypothetical protein